MAVPWHDAAGLDDKAAQPEVVALEAHLLGAEIGFGEHGVGHADRLGRPGLLAVGGDFVSRAGAGMSEASGEGCQHGGEACGDEAVAERQCCGGGSRRHGRFPLGSCGRSRCVWGSTLGHKLRRPAVIDEMPNACDFDSVEAWAASAPLPSGRAMENYLAQESARRFASPHIAA